jgi:hypothetical protein
METRIDWQAVELLANAQRRLLKETTMRRPADLYAGVVLSHAGRYLMNDPVGNIGAGTLRIVNILKEDSDGD